MYIQEATGKHLMVRGGEVSKPLLDDALERLYLEHRFCPTFILLSTQVRKDGWTDYHQVYRQVVSMSSHYPMSPTQEELIRFDRLFGGTPTLLYVNQITGFLTPIYGHRYLPERTMVFGSYDVDAIVRMPPHFEWMWTRDGEGEGSVHIREMEGENA